MGGPAGSQELGSQWSLVRGVHGREWEKRMADAGSEFYKSECKDTGSRASPLVGILFSHTTHTRTRARRTPCARVLHTHTHYARLETGRAFARTNFRSEGEDRGCLCRPRTVFFVRQASAQTRKGRLFSSTGLAALMAASARPGISYF